MSDMTIDLKKNDKFRSPDSQERRPQWKLSEVLESGVIEPKPKEPKHEYRYLRLESFF